MSAPRKTILVIEDEPEIVLGLTDALEFEGFAVIAAETGKAGVALMRSRRPDAVLLDLMLPDSNGFVVCEQLRQIDALVPILMLTARSAEADKIRGLEAGADDYVTKPFGLGELIARIRALFRRVERAPDVPDVFEIGAASIDLGMHTVTRANEREQLSFYEVGLLRLLYDRAGQPVSRDEILKKVWGVEPAASNRTVDNFIVKLRRKVEAQPETPAHILTVYGFGYKLV
jgi:DNA-binding response OmpR family regulator